MTGIAGHAGIHGVHRPGSTQVRRRDLLCAMTVPWKALAAAVLVLAGLCGAAQADPFGPIAFRSYKLENRPIVVFPPPPKKGAVHVSPYPSSKRAASVWTSDFCWRACTGETAWRFEACIGAHGFEACRPALDADNRVCLRTCRSRGGPMVNLAF